MTTLLPPTKQNIEQCAYFLGSGKLVSFPTETVYGLGANGFDQNAVENVYTVKRRPFSDPLILHFSTIEKVLPHVIMDKFQQSCFFSLAQNFWPGPLTIVLPKSRKTPDYITGGSSFVGVRIPNHPIALELLSFCMFPVAAPSANLFNHISPSTYQHVYDDFPEENNLYILESQFDQMVRVGIESTIVKIENDHLSILRLGFIGLQQIKESLTKVFPNIKINYKEKILKESQTPESSGQFLTHYSPFCETFLYQNINSIPNNKNNISLNEIALIDFGKKVFLGKNLYLFYKDLSPSGNFLEASRNLFSYLREAEKQKDVKCILIPDFRYEKNEVAQAIQDRMFRAASGKLFE